jgi:hypothetical protein
MTDRVTLCLPQDVARAFDTTVRNTTIDADTFQATPDDWDLLVSIIEDVEHEFHTATNDKMKVGTKGQPGSRETYEQATYKLSGHKLTKGTFTGVWTEYLPEQKSIRLDKERILPFDTAEGDQIYIYRGLDDNLSGGWEDVSDEQGTMWDILNHQEGVFTFSPIETAEYLMDYHVGAVSGSVPSFLRHMRFAITYRYGSLGGTRDTTSETSLDATLSATDEGTITVTDGSRFPSSGQVIVQIGREYLSVKPDPQNDSMDILERAVRGTEAQEHESGANVYYTPPAVRKAVASKAAASLATSSRGQKWLPDNEDDLDKNDIIQNLNQTWQTTIEVLQ